MVEMVGYEPIKVDVTAIDQTELELPFILIPLGCPLTVTTEPAKVAVTIDGKPAGTAPVQRRVRGGSYYIEAALRPGEPPVARRVSCDEKEQRPIEVKLAADAALAPGEVASVAGGGDGSAI